MKSGGIHHCAEYCRHFDVRTNVCRLRKVNITNPFWTTCRNVDQPGRTLIGPLHAIVFQVNYGSGAYVEIPYFEGCRVTTVQRSPNGDTVVFFTDGNGEKHEFASADEYIQFFSGNNEIALK